MNKNKTHKKVVTETLVNFILDKSGSMSSVQDATVSGFNEYLETLKKDGNKYSFSLTLFDTRVVNEYVNVPIKDVKNLDKESYHPDGMTALYDAVCRTVNEVKRDLKNSQKVITIIMTDGQENSSTEFNQAYMRDLIKSLEKTGKWTFVFLGANQDSYATAQTYGIPQMNTANFVASSAGVSATMKTMSANTRAFAGGGSASTSSFFSTSDQANLANSGTNSGTGSVMLSASDGSVYSADNDGNISKHFSELGKKSWDKRKKDLLK